MKDNESRLAVRGVLQRSALRTDTRHAGEMKESLDAAKSGDLLRWD
jgi:hypothetical protein